MKSGLYIVTLNNSEPISVKNGDKRNQNKSIKVSKGCCKIGRAENMNSRKKNYDKTFGTHNVNFRSFVFLKETIHAESLIKKALAPFCIKGRTGIKNEWLRGIEISDIERIILLELDQANINYILAVEYEKKAC